MIKNDQNRSKNPFISTFSIKFDFFNLLINFYEPFTDSFDVLINFFDLLIKTWSILIENRSFIKKDQFDMIRYARWISNWTVIDI